MSKTGDMQAFPPVLTYRQWLIGQALSGVAANPYWDDSDYYGCARVAISYADAVLEKLDSEQKKDKP
jgi:hypothetical protein